MTAKAEINKLSKEKLKKDIKEELKDKNAKTGACDDEDCEETGYLWNHENGDDYMVCPYHFMIYLHTEMGKVAIRDYVPISGWNEQKQKLLTEVRNEVMGFLRFNHNRYYYNKKVEKKLKEK